MKSASPIKNAPVPKSSSETRPAFGFVSRPTRESSEIGRALFPPGSSPGSQMQPGAPQSHQLPTSVRPAIATVEKAVGAVSLSPCEGENRSGRAKMQTAANTSLVLTSYSSKAVLADSEIVINHGGLFRHIVTSHLAETIHSQELFVKLANELIRFAEQAYMVRNVEVLDEVSQVLMNLPVNFARQIGLYYHALAINRKGQIDEAEGLLETVADNAPITYRARAIQTLGTNNHAKFHLDEALRLQLEALRVAADNNARGLQTTLMAHLEISHIASDSGDHKGALAILENASPLLHAVARQSPLYFYLYHNELAIELGELGRIAEARAASKVALASTYAPAYPNWAETRHELEAKRTSATPSVIAIHRAPEADPAPQVEPQRQPKPSRAVTFSCPASDKDFFQRSTTPIPATATIPLYAISILDRVLVCIGPRAPPSLS